MRTCFVPILCNTRRARGRSRNCRHGDDDDDVDYDHDYEDSPTTTTVTTAATATRTTAKSVQRRHTTTDVPGGEAAIGELPVVTRRQWAPSSTTGGGGGRHTHTASGAHGEKTTAYIHVYNIIIIYIRTRI